MVRKKDTRKLIVALSILGVLLIAILTVTIINAINSNDADVPSSQETNQTSSTSDTSKKPETNTKDTDTSEANSTETTSGTDTVPALDPATVATIDIAPMDLTVSYVKGAGGFEYQVLRTPNGSQYVEFRSPELVGTKCTDDNGTFVSILEDPSTGEGSTITKSVTVDGTQYGLSLAAVNCTSDAEKLQNYQQSFADAFSLLKKLD
jgi:hypothetical protein